MRELFEDVAANGALDPQEAVRQTTRAPQRKRFYKAASLDEVEGGFAVVLDGKSIRTPAGQPVVVPNREIANAVVEEWNAQGEFIDPMTMPLTRLANSTIDGVMDNVAAVADDIEKFFGSDLLFYRAAFPEELIARQTQHWDPVLRWAADDLGAHFILTEGIMHVTQPDKAVAAARAALPADAWRVAALHVVTTVTGSALLALALAQGALSRQQVWAAAHVDEDWNSEKWGSDGEVELRRAARLLDFEAAATVLKALV